MDRRSCQNPTTEERESCIELMVELVVMANISNFHPNQIDIAHPTSSNTNAPIIILFCKKRDRINFYSQRKKARDLTSDHFKIVGAEVNSEELAQVNHRYIYINESITPENCRLLKAARLESKKQKYKHKRYTMNGQVCVRKDDQSDVIYI